MRRAKTTKRLVLRKWCVAALAQRIRSRTGATGSVPVPPEPEAPLAPVDDGPAAGGILSVTVSAGRARKNKQRDVKAAVITEELGLALESSRVNENKLSVRLAVEVLTALYSKDPTGFKIPDFQLPVQVPE